MNEQLNLSRQFRAVALKRDEIDKEARTVPLAFSSEAPVERWWGIEVLGHKSGEVDMDWLGSGNAPVLADHDTHNQIGVVQDAEIGTDRKGRAVARFGKSQRAESEFQDVCDGVRTNVSVGYEIDELLLVREENGIKQYRATKWRPLEISLVSIPADMSVGVGRAGEAGSKPVRIIREHETPNNHPKETIMDPTIPAATQAAPATAPVDVNAVRTAAMSAERERIKDITYLGSRHNFKPLADKAIADGATIDQFRGLVLAELEKRGSADPLYQPAAEIGLSERESRQFSVARYMRSLIDNDPTVAPFEHECAKAVRGQMEKAGYRGQGKGNYIPFDVMRQPLPGARVEDGRLMVGQRDLSTTTIGAGGAMVATDLLAADFITLLRNASLVRRMGARLLSGLVGNVAIPRQTGNVTIGWFAQAGAASESDGTFAQVTLSQKTAHGIQDVTRDLLLQGTPAVEGLVRADLIESMATQIDLIALHGTGASNQPTGLAATAGIGSVAGGVNGLAPTWDNIVDLESAVANNNGAQGTVGYLTNTRVRGKLKRTQKFSGTNGQEIWGGPYAGDDPALFGQLNGYRAGVSNNVSNTLTKGTSTSVCSAIFFGNWGDLLIGEWGTAEILPDPYTQAANRIVRMHVYQSIDIAVRRAQSFAAMLDALTV